MKKKDVNEINREIDTTDGEIGRLQEQCAKRPKDKWLRDCLAAKRRRLRSLQKREAIITEENFKKSF